MNIRTISLTLVLLILLTALMPVVEVFASGIPNVVIDENGKVVLTQPDGTAMPTNAQDTWNVFLTKYRAFISGLSGMAAISFIVFFIVQFMKLGATSGNPMQRAQALGGIMWTGIAAAGLGSVSIFFTFFYGAFS